MSLVKIIEIMGELNSHQIARIILKMRYETATEEEKRVLEAWMKAGDGRQAIYDRIVSDESLREYRDLKAEFEGVTDYGKLQSDILGTLAENGTGRENFNESPCGEEAWQPFYWWRVCSCISMLESRIRKGWERCRWLKSNQSRSCRIR